MGVLDGKRAMVCGSTRGIGKAAAIALAKAGASVTLVARNAELLERTLGELAGDGNDFLVADFDSPEQVKDTVQKHVAASSDYQILINNTGGPPGGPILDATVDEFSTAFARHLICNHLISQTLIPAMKEAKYGRIINVISTSVRQPIPGLGVSNTIRGAVASWAKTLAGEVGRFGITVNNVLPGFTDTDRLRSLISTRASAAGKTEDEIVAQMVATIPAGRFAEPDETADAILFLASPAASYINGTSLPVDGGRITAL